MRHNPLRHWACVATSAVLLVAGRGAAQTVGEAPVFSGAAGTMASPVALRRPSALPAQDSLSRSKALHVARDIMRAARYCALITLDASTGVAARTIDPAPPDSAMTVRFVTNPRTRKVQQLARDARVALYYFDAPAQRYVTLYGRARQVRDAAEKRRQWYEAWTPFYPAREQGATLFVVVPERLEVVSPGDGVVGDTLSWAPPTVRFAAPRARR